MRGDKITTKLNRVEYETMTEEEKMLSVHAEKLMDDSNDDTDDIEQKESYG